jgi:ketosteroid isomerase-like protein
MAETTEQAGRHIGGAGVTQGSDRPIADLEKLGQAWAAAELRGDAAFLGRTLTDDFIGIGPRGFMLTKEQWLGRYASGSLRYDSFSWDEVRVRVYGDAAVLTGRQSQSGVVRPPGTDRDQDVTAQLRATLVFVKQNGDWRLAGLHLSPIGELTVGG